MSQRVAAAQAQIQDTPRTEFNIIVDGVIAVPDTVDQKLFFDGLLDAILEFVEKHDGRAALSLEQSESIETDGEVETDNGEQGSQDR